MVLISFFKEFPSRTLQKQQKQVWGKPFELLKVFFFQNKTT